MPLDKFHATKKDDHWQLKKVGAERASLTAATKQELVKQTSQYMDNKTGSVRIHKVDGTIQEERTYQRANDPKTSKG